MRIIKAIYEKVTGKSAPYYFDYSLITILIKPIRKFFVQVIAPNIVFNSVRIIVYRLCGFKIRKTHFHRNEVLYG